MAPTWDQTHKPQKQASAFRATVKKRHDRLIICDLPLRKNNADGYRTGNQIFSLIFHEQEKTDKWLLLDARNAAMFKKGKPEWDPNTPQAYYADIRAFNADPANGLYRFLVRSLPLAQAAAKGARKAQITKAFNETTRAGPGVNHTITPEALYQQDPSKYRAIMGAMAVTPTLGPSTASNVQTPSTAVIPQAASSASNAQNLSIAATTQAASSASNVQTPSTAATPQAATSASTSLADPPDFSDLVRYIISAARGNGDALIAELAVQWQMVSHESNAFNLSIRFKDEDKSSDDNPNTTVTGKSASKRQRVEREDHDEYGDSEDIERTMNEYNNAAVFQHTASKAQAAYIDDDDNDDDSTPLPVKKIHKRGFEPEVTRKRKRNVKPLSDFAKYYHFELHASPTAQRMPASTAGMLPPPTPSWSAINREHTASTDGIAPIVEQQATVIGATTREQDIQQTFEELMDRHTIETEAKLDAILKQLDASPPRSDSDDNGKGA